MSTGKITFRLEDGLTYEVSDYLSGENLHKLARAIRDGTIQGMTVETPLPITQYERVEYIPVKPAERSSSRGN